MCSVDRLHFMFLPNHILHRNKYILLTNLPLAVLSLYNSLIPDLSEANVSQLSVLLLPRACHQQPVRTMPCHNGLWEPVTRAVVCLLSFYPSPSARQHPSYDDCLEVKREYYQNCSVLDCVTQSSQSAAHLYEQFLQVQQIGFVTLGLLRCA